MLSGKSIYIEGNDFAQDHHQYKFFELTGCGYKSDGNDIGNVTELFGEDSSFCEGNHFLYGHEPGPRVKSDVLTTKNGANVLFRSQDSLIYGAYMDNGIYRIITTSIVLSGIVDGESPNTKIELMAQYLNFLERKTSSIDFPQEKSSLPDNFQIYPSYPNPFSNSTQIHFRLNKPSSDVRLLIYNMLGQHVKTLMQSTTAQGEYFINWDGTDSNQFPVPPGTYFFQLKSGQDAKIGKLILVR